MNDDRHHEVHIAETVVAQWDQEKARLSERLSKANQLILLVVDEPISSTEIGLKVAYALRHAPPDVEGATAGAIEALRAVVDALETEIEVLEGA